MQSGNQDCSWTPYVMRTPDAAMRTSAARAEMASTIDARSIGVFEDRPLPYHQHVGATAVAHLRVATIFVAAHLTRTSPDRTYGQLLHLPHQDLLRTRDVRVGAGGGSADAARNLTERAAPTTPLGGVIESHATMEHSRVSRAALRAGRVMVARKCWPPGPSRGQGPAWPDHESSWAVPPGYVPEDELSRGRRSGPGEMNP
jgi:hypothetical protein